MPENMQQILDRILDFWNTGNSDLAQQLYSTDVQYYGPSQTDNSPEEIAAYVTELHTAFPDFKLEIHNSVSCGDRLISQWICSGTQQGEYQGIPATGKSVQVSGVTIANVENGRITHEHVYYDRLTILEQLGVAASHIRPEAAVAAPAS